MQRKRVTSKDVAERVGVSRTTVSLVLNNVRGIQISPETRQKVIDAANELGYVPDATAQALASRRTKAIGLVLTRTQHHIATDAFLPKIISGLLNIAKKQNVRILVDWVETEHQESAYFELAHAKRIDGMILSTPRLNDKALKALERVDIPTVLMGRVTGSNLPFVDVDNTKAAEKATSYLIGLGHRKIACISSAPPEYTATPERVGGFRNAMERMEIPINEDLIRYADFDPESGYECMRSLLRSGEEFTAVFVASDNVAIGAKAALREAGLRIPDDVSLVGFDDIPWAKYSDPPLTTVQLPAESLAHSACTLLLDLIQNKDQQREYQIILDTELIVRKSCKPL
ncbi:MAG: LacI family transcriptional regulator [Anaerolineales bacterium]|nr:LacI family transcriptional regulator [Anaerolineae bacterium]PWB73170.1 MAG: LacI family transcriptional regulator [Anaerolineales bacterium]